MVGGVRNIRKDNGIPNRDKLELLVHRADEYPTRLESSIAHLTNLQSISEVSEKVEGAFGFMVGRHRFYIPFSETFDTFSSRISLGKFGLCFMDVGISHSPVIAGSVGVPGTGSPRDSRAICCVRNFEYCFAGSTPKVLNQ